MSLDSLDGFPVILGLPDHTLFLQTESVAFEIRLTPRAIEGGDYAFQYRISFPALLVIHVRDHNCYELQFVN